jgi:hypothetical protein
MNDIVGMAVVNCRKQLVHDFCRLLLAKYLIFLHSNLVEQLASIDILHHQIDVLLVVISLEILHNVGVI